MGYLGGIATGPIALVPVIERITNKGIITSRRGGGTRWGVQTRGSDRRSAQKTAKSEGGVAPAASGVSKVNPLGPQVTCAAQRSNPHGPNMAQNGPQVAPKWSRRGFLGPKFGHDRPNWPQTGCQIQVNCQIVRQFG
ncbi:MAG: hypothetical protein ACK56F_15460, partial [bacterium]